MKKVFSCIILSCLLILSLSMNVFAFTNNEFQNVNELEELKFLESEIVEWVDSIYKSETSYSDNILKEDIKWNNTTKVFVDVDLFDIPNTKEDIKNVLLSSAKIVYEVPVVKNDSTYITTISKGLPLNKEAIDALDDETIANIQNNVGKWQIAKISSYQNDFSYEEEISVLKSKARSNDGTIVVIGGIPHINTPVAILLDDSVESMTFIGEPVTEFSNENTSRSTSNDIYNYNNIKNQIDNMQPIGEDESGGSSFDMNSKNAILYFAVGSIMFIICALIVIKRRRGIR